MDEDLLQFPVNLNQEVQRRSQNQCFGLALHGVELLLPDHLGALARSLKESTTLHISVAEKSLPPLTPHLCLLECENDNSSAV